MRRNTSAGLAIGVALALALGPRKASAIPPPHPGVGPEFSISAYVMDPPRYLAKSSLHLSVWGGSQYDSLAIGEARLEIPPGISWMSGDTLRHVLISAYVRRPPSDRSWVVVIRPDQTGRYELKGTLRIDGGPRHGVDETDFVLGLDVRPDSVRYDQAPRTIRYENVRGGQRFRYADGYLIPIDSTEAFVEAGITKKPHALPPKGSKSGGWSTVRTGGLEFAAIVAKDGRLLNLEIVEEPGAATPNPAQVDAAKRAIEGWSFVPAEVEGRTVPDYFVFRVKPSAKH